MNKEYILFNGSGKEDKKFAVRMKRKEKTKDKESKEKKLKKQNLVRTGYSNNRKKEECTV